MNSNFGQTSLLDTVIDFSQVLFLARVSKEANLLFYEFLLRKHRGQ